MRKSHRTETILVELILVILMFMLVSTVIVETFAAARRMSDKANVRSEAISASENLAEQLYLTPDAASLLEENGFSLTESVWSRKMDNYELVFTETAENRTAGTLLHRSISAVFRQENLFTLPCDLYWAEEGSK